VKKTKPPSQAVTGDDAMKKDTSERFVREEFGSDTIEQIMREKVREKIEMIVGEELMLALGAGRYERVGEDRQGYLHGTRSRTLTTSLGPTKFEMPRARVNTKEGGTTEWKSQVVPRYQRRTQRIDEAILGVYLSGSNTRRIRGALAPLLKGGPLSKDAVSRLVGRLSGDFNEWRDRDLKSDEIRYLYMDGWYPRVRLGKHRVRVPVLVALGVRADGERIVLDMRMAGQESTASWDDIIKGLVKRNMGTPLLAVVDGNPGLESALVQNWPQIEIQRCTTHKLRNLEARAPARLREELKEDYRRMIYAETRDGVQQQRERFVRKWKLQCPPVIESLNEVGDRLFTFLKFPKSQWKALRTTNALERINEEFRRRTKTQTSLPSHDAVMLLIFGLLRTGQIRLRKMDGWQDMAKASSINGAIAVSA
jgi:putative transposase